MVGFLQGNEEESSRGFRGGLNLGWDVIESSVTTYLYT